MSANQTQARDRRLWGAFMLAVGLFIVAISIDLIKVDESTIHAPRWVLFLVAAVFASAGLLLFVGQNSPASDLLAAIVLFSLGAIGVWVSLFGSSEEFSGGFALFPREANVSVARVLFGFGAMITLAMSAYAVRQAFRHDS